MAGRLQYVSYWLKKITIPKGEKTMPRLVDTPDRVGPGTTRRYPVDKWVEQLYVNNGQSLLLLRGEDYESRDLSMQQLLWRYRRRTGVPLSLRLVNEGILVSIENMQEIVDANEKLVEELKEDQD